MRFQKHWMRLKKTAKLNMIYNHRLLNEEEASILYALIQHYKGYDKLDILIEMSTHRPQELMRTEKVRLLLDKKVKNEAMPEELKFCDSDQCEIPLQFLRRFEE